MHILLQQPIASEFQNSGVVIEVASVYLFADPLSTFIDNILNRVSIVAWASLNSNDIVNNFELVHLFIKDVLGCVLVVGFETALFNKNLNQAEIIHA